jgi:sialate O-acetylesterase
LYEKDIENSENSSIRFFTVPQQYNFNSPQSDLPSGLWQSASPNTVPGFSAIAYFFAKEIFDQYKVPVGILHSSLGGSPAEAWISEDALKAFSQHYSEAQRFKDSTLIRQIESQDKARIQAWYTLLRQKDEGFSKLQQPWYSPNVSVSGWDSISIPGYWAKTSLGAVNGVVWFRKDIQLTANMIGIPAKLILGTIVDADSVFVNGVFVGTTSYMYPPRWYDVSSSVLHEGLNTIVVRGISNSGRGGFVSNKTYALTAGKTTVNLQGNWKYKLGATMDPLAGQTFIRWKPVGLYNAVIAPLINYNVRGVVWYQGESNTSRPGEYKDLLSTLILDWRSK